MMLAGCSSKQNEMAGSVPSGSEGLAQQAEAGAEELLPSLREYYVQQNWVRHFEAHAVDAKNQLERYRNARPRRRSKTQQQATRPDINDVMRKGDSALANLVIFADATLLSDLQAVCPTGLVPF